MSKVVIASTTFYRSPAVRDMLALRSAEEARRIGLPLVVVDGGSYPGFVEKLTSLGAIVHPETDRGMGPSRRQVLRLAAELAGKDGVVQWSEPEKHTFVKFIPKVAKPILDGVADLVLPWRKSLESYHRIQALSEEEARINLHDLIGVWWDFYFGPVALKASTALQCFLEYNPMNDVPNKPDTWEMLRLPILDVYADRTMRVVSVTVDYVHPPEQNWEEEGDAGQNSRRLLQRLNIDLATHNRAYRLGLTAQKPPEKFF